MRHVIDSLTQRPFLTLVIGAFLSGVTLLYLVRLRIRRQRIKQAGQENA